jgi:hypothetical protein
MIVCVYGNVLLMRHQATAGKFEMPFQWIRTV